MNLDLESLIYSKIKFRILVDKKFEMVGNEIRIFTCKINKTKFRFNLDFFDFIKFEFY